METPREWILAAPLGGEGVSGDRGFDGEGIRRDLRDVGAEATIDVKGGRSAPSGGLRLRMLRFKEAGPPCRRGARRQRILDRRIEREHASV